MKIAFFSNYLTHHQIPFCEEMRKLPGVEFTFVSTMEMEEDRKTGGWVLEKEYAYELKAWLSEEAHQQALALAAQSDVMLIGSAPEIYVKHRMANHPNPLTLRYSERIYKGGRWRVLSPRGAIIRLQTYFRYIRKPLYMLCASAYTAGDLAMLGSYLGRCFRWGYFPETKHYDDVDGLIAAKKPASILWVARFLELKHPEYAVEVARRLREDGYSFTLNMIGNGEEEESIRELISQNDLSDCVYLLGSMKPEEVRRYMEESEIFLFTSDRNEGWGAVLNESMNSACAVVASHAIGSVPFLLQNGENGLVYKSGNVDDLYCKVKSLLCDAEKRKRLARNAYVTITEEWNAENAAKKLLGLCEELLVRRIPCFPYDRGVCGKAKRLRGNWK